MRNQRPTYGLELLSATDCGCYDGDRRGWFHFANCAWGRHHTVRTPDGAYATHHLDLCAESGDCGRLGVRWGANWPGRPETGTEQ